MKKIYALFAIVFVMVIIGCSSPVGDVDESPVVESVTEKVPKPELYLLDDYTTDYVQFVSNSQATIASGDLVFFRWSPPHIPGVIYEKFTLWEDDGKFSRVDLRPDGSTLRHWGLDPEPDVEGQYLFRVTDICGACASKLAYTYFIKMEYAIEKERRTDSFGTVTTIHTSLSGKVIIRVIPYKGWKEKTDMVQ